jgi:hypothetical protein
MDPNEGFDVRSRSEIEETVRNNYPNLNKEDRATHINLYRWCTLEVLLDIRELLIEQENRQLPDGK